MGWVWNGDGDTRSDGVNQYGISSPRSGDRCSTRRIVRSQCKTEEVEPGKFIRKCEKTEELLKDCVGRPTEVVLSDKEYTEEDVTEQVVNGKALGTESSHHGSFNFPGLRSDIESFNFPGLKSDIEAIERSVFGGMNRFIEAAEEMANGIFGTFGSPHVYDGDSSSSSKRRGIPIDDHPPKESSSSTKADKQQDGEIDLSGLAKDV